MEHTKVSIIIPTKNDRGYLKHAIASAEAQSYQNKEIIVVRSDERVGKNINDGFKQSTGDLIYYFADDDLMAPGSVAKAVASIQDYDFIHANALRFGGKLLTIYKPDKKYPNLAELVNHNYIHGGTCFYKRDCFERFLFDEKLWTGEEYDMHLRMLAGGMKLGYVDDVLFKYRLHPGQKSIGNKNNEYQRKRQIAIKQIKDRYR